MRGLAIASIALGLAACGQQAAPEPEPAPEPAKEASPAFGPGLFAVGDGTQIYSRTRLSEDGTYTDFNEEMEPVGGGTWRPDGENVCFDPEGEGEDQQERCWRNDPPDEDGSFMTYRLDSSEQYKVTPLETASPD